jgi:hypothetical protein
MTTTVTMLQTRLGENGSLWTIGNSYAASDAFAAVLISSNLATGTLPKSRGLVPLWGQTDNTGAVASVVDGGGNRVASNYGFLRWCLPGRDVSGASFKDVSGKGNDGIIEASNAAPFAVDKYMSTAAHASAGGINLPLAAGQCNPLTDSFLCAVEMTNADPGASAIIMSFGASATAGSPGLYLSHRSSAAGVGRVVVQRGDGTLVSGSDSTVKFSNAGGTRPTHALMALDAPSGSVYLYRDGVLAAANVGLMTGANAFTLGSMALGPRLGSTGGTASTFAGVYRGWQGYVFAGKGLPLNIGRVASMLADSPNTPLHDSLFVFAS